MRALALIAVAFLFLPMACGSSGPSFGGGGAGGGSPNGGSGTAGDANGGSANGGSADGGSNETGGKAEGGSKANGGGGTSANGGDGPGMGMCDSKGTCSDEMGCAVCALKTDDCMTAINTCVGMTACRMYAACCMGKFPCAASCGTGNAEGLQEFAPVKACVCGQCTDSCNVECR